MQEAAASLRYEDAQIVKKQIQNIEYLTTTYIPPREFLEQPTLVDDLTLTRLKDLKDKLNLKKVPKRIECYDISNIAGYLATGSMVVFINGYPEKSQYRRFRVKFTRRPNDFAMIKEVIARRFKNDWPLPDLVIIDGGKGQLSSALEIINTYHPGIPVVSLAKRLEEIYTPGESRPITLPKESPARQLTQAIRDEAHRFAITYHRLLRSKNFLK
jgi:excinuclease ABC subunit C